MEGEFSQIAGRIAQEAKELQGIDPRQLGELLENHFGEINCYPGMPGAECYPLAFFVALQGKMSSKKWPLKFDGMLEAFIRHMQGDCEGATRNAVIITDTWSAIDFEKWAGNVRTITQRANVEMYLVGYGGWSTRVYF